ncbi:uncharacterized protein NKAPD1-like [Centruroides sculpturatus]|uniref:uncharacterized protein NKAPD1-like n=1 Tax=Centruroides sculpturatus TaxID=218467 RepID=UPI000C6D0145|nr:uncharacterized protein NKAPD1-like [Centruroides sculpturatus]XP_023216768.1 uncharacterized protein NKAPD1-like [Centruroides sculpturatus]XP_023216769.1 uncharacterized protein NKAPD1-like [Centruroides sculpturatus]
MVTRAGKKLLRNTIRTIDHHNRVLEEQDMWRQWELQQGLTMMVSDDAVHSRSKYLKMDLENHSQRYKPEYRESVDLDLQNQDVKSLKKMRNYWLNKLVEAEEQDPDRWGHSGYKELYPEEFNKPSSSKSDIDKCCKRKKSKKKKKIKKKTSKEKSSDSSEESSEVSSDETSSSSKSYLQARKKLKDGIVNAVLINGENIKKCKKKAAKKIKLHGTINKKRKEKYKKRRRKTKSQDGSLELIWVEKTADGS